jgi:hypothetical protein
VDDDRAALHAIRCELLGVRARLEARERGVLSTLDAALEASLRQAAATRARPAVEETVVAAPVAAERPPAKPPRKSGPSRPRAARQPRSR